MEAQTNDSASCASTGHNDENNNQVDKCTYEKICSSCGTEKATKVCSACTSQVKTSNIDSLPALKMSDLDEYFNLGVSDAKKLISEGHMAYCHDCFEIIHSNLDTSKHIGINIAQTNENTESLFNENIKLIVEDKLDDLIDQIELSSHLGLNEQSIRQFESELVGFRRRSSHFNDVKQSIREMNDIIRDDLYLDFGALAGLMEKKLNDISDRIKEKLKDAYSVVRDIQNKINEKIDILEQSISNLEQMRQQSTLSIQEIKIKEEDIASQIEQLNEELKSICEPNFNFNSCYNSTFSCSLFVDNNLYPQFNYNVDLSKLIEAIGEISVNISPSTCEPKPWTFHDQMYLNPEFEFEAVINSGIQTNGSFWVQFIAPFEPSDSPVALFKKNRIRSNQVLEEISRYVRSKTISDKEWLSYEQMNLSPKQGEKCFCLDEKTRKWYRARILSVDHDLRKCHVFYVDTGFSDINQLHSFDQILPWRDFNLANLPNRAIKCLLYNNNNNSSSSSDASYEQHVHQESKFLFKDLTAAKAIKCVLVEPTVLDDLQEAWICKVYQINEEKNFQFVSVNKKIIESNKKENSTPRDTAKFASRDIRLQSVRSSKASPLSSSSSFTPQNANSTIVTECKNKFEKVSHRPDTREEFSQSSESNRQTNSENEPFDTNLDYSSVLNVEDTHEENLDVEDQIAERRFFKNSSGMCHVTTSMSNEGIFWIKPIIKYNLHEEFEKLSPLIDEFIRRTNYRSYGDLKIEPQLHKKCFVRTCLKKSVAFGFYRGFIEKVFANREQCRVRLMDHGYAREVSYMDMYPHRRLDFNSIASNNDIDGFNDTDNHGLKLNYLSIRCCLFQSNFNNLKTKKDYFNSLISNRRVHFNLVEQISIGKLKCWYTELSMNNELINMKIFSSIANDSIKKSKSEGVVKQLSVDAEKSSSVTTSNTNREWQPIETHPVTSHLPRSNSMYDLKENSSLVGESLDESRSIKVKSDAQSGGGFETRAFNRRKKNAECKSLPYRDEKRITHSKYESCPLFMHEPEWIVNSDQVVNQPSFVNIAEPSTASEKDESKRKKLNRNQCRPFEENFFNWDHDRNNGNGSSSSKFSRSKTNSRRPRNSRSTNNNANQSYKGKSYKIHETDEDNSSAFNDVFLNNDNSSLDQDEFDVENRNPLNSSPNSPYNKLFKINPQINSYEQVLSRISESESLKNMNYGLVGINGDNDNIRLEEAEKIRSLNLTQNSEQIINKIEAHDTSLDSMPRLIIDQTDEEAVNEPVHPTLDQTHQIPNRHIINDIETNRSIKFAQKVAHNCKNRSYSAADVALVERNRLNLKPVLVSSTSSSSDISSSLTDLKKKITDIDSDDSFESCAEEVKNYDLKAKESKWKKTDLDFKMERMKKFTVSIFVDDFEADSSKNSNDSSTSLSINEVEQTRLNPNFFTVRSSCDEKKSLEEFEKNEAVHSYRRLTLDQEVFMFTGHPVQIDANRASLAARPPVGPTQLSTIVELSNECSNNTDCESKKAASLEESSKNWISEIENNSSEFQKKIDFFNKNQDKQDIDYKNVTVRKMRRNSRDYDTLNESRRTKSASSLSDNGHLLNSLSNNCLISESFHLSGARLNVTLETSFNSRIRHNSSNSILITDQLFEKFCQLENDHIMNESNDSLIDLAKSKNNNKFKIKSKLLNELLNEPVSLPQRSSSSPDISSYNSDSLFNSHLIITPICSELVSPNQPVSIISRSISNQQSTPHKNSHSLKSPNSQSSLPPTPPQAQIRDEDNNNVTFSPIQKVKDDERDFLKSKNDQNLGNSLSHGPHLELQNIEVKVDKNSSCKNYMSRDSNLVLQNIEVKVDKNSSCKNDMSHDSNLILQSTEVKDESKSAALPPAPHFPLIKPSRAQVNRSDKDSLMVSNSCPNLADRHTNKHVAIYLNTVKNSTGVDLEPVKRRSNSATRMSNFKSANLSLYGLDNDEEQETKRRSLSEGDSIDGRSCAQKISLDTSEPIETESFKFPPPPEQFMNSSCETLPPPPDPKELDALNNNGDNPQPTSSSSQTTIIPLKTESPRLKTFMNSLKNLQNTSPIKTDNSFKIDNLLDINPKRLYKNSKFKCKINDVLSENGRFWIEVIYNEDDERKFLEMFKYFNLYVRLAEAPKSLVKNQHVAAMYKNSWHRALVLDNYDTDPSKVKVRFLDIGLEKILDKQTDLRETDEKFFNFPIKALYCSLYIDEHVDQLTIDKQLKLNKRLYVCKEARKHFVKMVYKKILYVKVIDFSQEYEPESETFRSICKIKLGCQARHGIIDVYMYLLSKYDREKYEFLKLLKKYIQTRPVLLSMEQESVQTTTITTTETNTLSTCTTTAIPSPPESLNATMLKKIPDVDSEDDCAQMENQEDDDLLDQEEDYDQSDEDDVLFTDTVNYYYSKNLNNKDASLDLTPVKDQHSKQSDLKITPIDLSKFDTPEENSMPAVDFSTAKVSNKLRATAANHKKSASTPIALPLATNLSDKYVKMIRKGQNSQEADTSLTAHCCNLTSLKKWAKSSNKNGDNLPKSFKIYAQEGFKENNTFDYSLNKSLNTKKVKFQIK